MRLNRDSSRLAVFVAAALAGVLLLLRLVGADVSGFLLILAPLITLVATYSAASVFIIRPIRRVVIQLHGVEERAFDALPDSIEGAGDIHSLQRAVISTGRTLEKELGNLERIETYRRDFLGNVSHELKTPIFAIQGFAETLLGGALEREDVRGEFVEKIRQNAVRLDNLANDLSEIAKIETGELTMRVRPFDAKVLLHEVVETLEARADAKGIKLGYTVSPGLPHVLADDERIRQVLLNLVDNGIKYTNEGGSVGIAARGVGGQVRFTVSDTGIGIAPQYIGRVTERFFRVDLSRSRAQGGTGLGLAIAKHILNAHGSQLRIASEPGHGSTFSFSLSASMTQAPDPSEASGRDH